MLVKFCKRAMWLLLVITVFFQSVAIYSIVNGNASLRYNYRALSAATIVMIIAVVLFSFLPRGKLIPFVVAVVTGVLFVLLAIQMLSVFKASTSLGGIDIGMTVWQILFRHMSPILIPLCMFPVFLKYREKRLGEKASREEVPPESYFELLKAANVEPLKEVPRPPKRSVRRRMEKEEKNRE